AAALIKAAGCLIVVAVRRFNVDSRPTSFRNLSLRVFQQTLSDSTTLLFWPHCDPINVEAAHSDGVLAKTNITDHLSRLLGKHKLITRNRLLLQPRLNQLNGDVNLRGPKQLRRGDNLAHGLQIRLLRFPAQLNRGRTPLFRFDLSLRSA